MKKIISTLIALLLLSVTISSQELNTTQVENYKMEFSNEIGNKKLYHELSVFYNNRYYVLGHEEEKHYLYIGTNYSIFILDEKFNSLAHHPINNGKNDYIHYFNVLEDKIVLLIETTDDSATKINRVELNVETLAERREVVYEIKHTDKSQGRYNLSYSPDKNKILIVATDPIEENALSVQKKIIVYNAFTNLIEKKDDFVVDKSPETVNFIGHKINNEGEVFIIEKNYITTHKHPKVDIRNDNYKTSYFLLTKKKDAEKFEKHMLFSDIVKSDIDISRLIDDQGNYIVVALKKQTEKDHRTYSGFDIKMYETSTSTLKDVYSKTFDDDFYKKILNKKEYEKYYIKDGGFKFTDKIKSFQLDHSMDKAEELSVLNVVAQNKSIYVFLEKNGIAPVSGGSKGQITYYSFRNIVCYNVEYGGEFIWSKAIERDQISTSLWNNAFFYTTNEKIYAIFNGRISGFSGEYSERNHFPKETLTCIMSIDKNGDVKKTKLFDTLKDNRNVVSVLNTMENENEILVFSSYFEKMKVRKRVGRIIVQED